MSQIRTFARIKPSTCLYEEFDVAPNTLQIRTPEVFRDFSTPGKFRATIRHEFLFNKVFDTSATQDEVFSEVARDIISGFLGGYNGTIFAYGQTGTGKTFTVEGSARLYKDRGLAPRALSMIYKSLEERSDEEITVHISYMEIYQEMAYDLLTSGARTFSPVTPLPRVSVVEGRGGSCVFRNLSVHLAASEEVAQSLLLQGQTSRKVAETPVNQRSSRSHAVFTIYLTAKKPDSDVIVRSKLHLVDLAGSERVAKTGVDGHQLTEAKSINLSLHHLETVIISLQDGAADRHTRSSHSLRQNPPQSPQLGRPYTGEDLRATRHVPYRNSLLTMVLRDSLGESQQPKSFLSDIILSQGGNCQTAMIATVSLEVQNIGESLSTCRFAQRVACIANHVIRNEEIDDQTLIRRLKKKVAELEAEIAFMRVSKEGECSEDAMCSKLTDEDKLHCAHVVHEYLGGRLTDPVTSGITDPYKFRECLRLLKKMVLSGYFNTGSGNNTSKDSGKGFQHKTSRGDGVAYLENSAKTVQILKISHDDGNGGADGDMEEIDNNNNNSVHKSRPPARPQQAWGEHANTPTTPTRSQQARSSSNPTTPQRLDTPSKYKSPYEKKRERDIHRLSRRVNTLQNSFESKEMELSELKHNVELQELDIMESGYKAKLAVTVDQISHQEAYLAQLRDTEAENDLIHQEKLVERQLRKRQAKFEKKIADIEKRKSQILKLDSGNDCGPKTPTKGKVEEKINHCRKRDGSLNTRQVFDMLKSEEKKQHKAQVVQEKEKILTVTRQLEVREAATRQKLRELKQMIRQSKDQPNGQSHDQSYDQEPNSQQRESRSQKRTTNNSEHIIQSEKHLNKSDSGSNQQKESASWFTRKGTKEERKVHEEFARPTSGISLRSANIPDSSFYAQRTDSVASRWDSAYSTRPSTSDTRPPTSDTRPPTSDQSQKQTPNSFSPSLSESSNLPNPNHMSYQTGQKYSSNEPIETVMPSEYVYGMSSAEQFDARRMGLSSKTFETALSSMLDKDEPITCSNAYYDQFARKGKVKHGSPSHKTSPSRRVEKTSTDDAKLRQSWGPEAKGSPVSAKLNQFFKDLSKPPPHNHGKASRAQAGEEFVSRLEELQTSPYESREKIRALRDEERETTYMSKAESERQRIAKIRKARQAAEVIQKAWRKQRQQR